MYTFSQAYGKFAGAKISAKPIDWTWMTITGSHQVIA